MVKQNDTAAIPPAPNQEYDSQQEIAQWLLDNEKTLAKLEDAIQAADPGDSPTAEFLRIGRELGGPERGLKTGLGLIRESIQDIEKLKAQYGIT